MDDNQPRVYAVRLALSVSHEINQEYDRLEALSGSAIADAWQDGLLAMIRTLATYPERCAVAPENHLFTKATIRHLIYRRTRSGPAWRILFSVHEADENDPATVRVQHIRHGARSPITADEAQALEQAD